MVEYCSLAPQDRVETLSSSGWVGQQCNVLTALMHNRKATARVWNEKTSLMNQLWENYSSRKQWLNQISRGCLRSASRNSRGRQYVQIWSNVTQRITGALKKNIKFSKYVQKTKSVHDVK